MSMLAGSPISQGQVQLGLGNRGISDMRKRDDGKWWLDNQFLGDGGNNSSWALNAEYNPLSFQGYQDIYGGIDTSKTPEGFKYGGATELGTSAGKKVFNIDGRYFFENGDGTATELTQDQMKELVQSDYDRNVYDYNYNQALNTLTDFNTGLDDRYAAINEEIAGVQGFDPTVRANMENQLKGNTANAYNEMSRLANEELTRRGISNSGIAQKSANDLSKSYMDNISAGIRSIDMDNLSMKKQAENELYNRRVGELSGELGGVQSNYGAFGDYSKYNKGLYNQALNRQQDLLTNKQNTDMDYKRWQAEMDLKRSQNQGGGWKGALGGIVGAGLGSLAGGAGTAIGANLGGYIGNSLNSNSSGNSFYNNGMNLDYNYK